MLRAIQTIMKALHSQWRTMGNSSYMALFFLMGLAYAVLSLQLLIEFIRSRIGRGLTKYDDVRAVQSWAKISPVPPPVKVTVPQKRPLRDRIDQTRATVKRYRHKTEERVDRRIDMLRKRVAA